MNKKRSDAIDVFRTLQNKRRWKTLAVIPLTADPRIHHPQGLKVIGDYFYLSTVDKVKKRGLLLKYRFNIEAKTAVLEDTLVLSAHPLVQKLFHCGGMEWDGEHLLIPMSEYRAYSKSRLLKVDPMKFEVVGISPLYPDHFGAVALVDSNAPAVERKCEEEMPEFDESIEASHSGIYVRPMLDSLIVLNWDAKNFYNFGTADIDKRMLAPQVLAAANDSSGELQPLGPLQPNEHVAYQDCKHLHGNYFICGGKLRGFFRLERGVLDLIRFDPKSNDVRRDHRVYVRHYTLQGKKSWSPYVLPLTHNTFDYQFFVNRQAFRMFFAPHDGPHNKLFVFEAHSSLRRQILRKFSKNEEDQDE